MNKNCCGGSCSVWCTISKILVIIGALNWGLVGIALVSGANNLNVVNFLFGGWPWLEAIIYFLVAISGLCLLATLGCGGKKCNDCGSGQCVDGKCMPKNDMTGGNTMGSGDKMSS